MSATFFLTGVSGAGKSTLAQLLKQKLDVPVHDFDELLPDDAAEPRKDASIAWLAQAKTYQDAGKSSVVVGLSYPSEILPLAKQNGVSPLYYGILTIPEAEIYTRLSRRSWDDALIANNQHLMHDLEKEVIALPYHIVLDGTWNARSLAEVVTLWVKEKTE